MSKTAYLFLAPSIFLIGLFVFIPFGYNLYLSFTSWRGIIGVEPIFIGFTNFIHLLTDPNLSLVIWNTLLYMSLATTGTVLLGLLIASLLDLKLRGWNFFRAVFYLSVLMPAVVTGRLFVTIYNPNVGLIQPIIDFFYGLFNIQAPLVLWLSSENVMFSIIIKDIWQYTGFPMLLLIAGLSSIPNEILEAAKVEGASEWQIFFRVKLPLIRNPFSVAVALQLIFSFRVFDSIWTMTQGGPGHASEALAVYLYKQAFQAQSFGYASAISVIMILIIFPIAISYLRLSRFGES